MSSSKSKSRSSTTSTSATENYSVQETSPYSLDDVENEGNFVVGREVSSTVNNQFGPEVASTFANLTDNAGKIISDTINGVKDVLSDSIRSNEVTSKQAFDSNSETIKATQLISQAALTAQNDAVQANKQILETAINNSQQLAQNANAGVAAVAKTNLSPASGAIQEVTKNLAFPLSIAVVFYFIARGSR